MKTSLDIQAWRNKYIYLLKEEDEFDEPINVSHNWNFAGNIELNVGDNITRDMWDDEAVIAAGEEDEFLNDEYWTIEHIGNGYVEIKSDQGGYIDWKIENVQALLKPDYKIVTKKNVFESDEFDDAFDISPNWNEFEGKVVITFVIEDEGYVYVEEEDEEEFDRLNPNARDNFSYDDEPIRSTVTYKSKPISIKDLNHWLEELVGISPQPYIKDQTTEGFKEWMKENDIDIDSLMYLYDILKPTELKTIYKDEYNNPVQITNRMKEKMDYYSDGGYFGKILDVKFDNEINESDDEWDIEVSDNWSFDTLGVEDIITPNMLNDIGKKWLKQRIYIQDIWENENGDIIVSIGSLSTRSWLSDIEVGHLNSWLKPEYRIGNDKLNESDEFNDEFDVSYNWGNKGLRAGDTITPDMWKYMWEEGWEHPIYIKDVDEDEDGIFVIIIRNNIEETRDVDELNFYLKPGYEITPF